MLRGIKVGDMIMVTDDPSAKPIVQNEGFADIPNGYKQTYEWVETPTQIVQSWTLEPIEGTAEQAALALSKLQAKSLPDEYALQVTALYDEWAIGQTYYGPDQEAGYAGDRIRYKGVLYKVLQGHVSQADWTPDAAPSLYAKVLPGQEGNEPEEGYGEWVQPDSTNGYALGDRVMHNGKIWESTFNGANVWEPGVQGTEALWKDVTDEVSSDDQGGVEE